MPRTLVSCVLSLMVAACPLIAQSTVPTVDLTGPHDQVDGEAYDLTATYPNLAPGAEIALVFDQREAARGHLLRVSAARTQLSRLENGKATLLTSGRGLPSSTPVEITVLRRPGVIRAFAGRTLLAEAYEPRAGGGACGSLQGAAVRPADLLAQEIGAIDFEDDFFAGDEAHADWKMLVGRFRIDTYWDPKQKLDNRPIGASWFANDGAGRHLAVAGQAFWDDYASEVSVRPAPGCAVGVAARVRDARNFVALKLVSVASGQSVAKLVEMSDGNERSLAEKPGAWLSGRWHRLRLEVAGQSVVAVLDGEAIGEGHLTGWQWGPVGLTMEGDDDCRFDDLAVHGRRRFDGAPKALPEGPWVFDSGSWRVVKDRLSCSAASPALAVASAGSWGDSDLHGRVTLNETAEAGLLTRWGKQGGYAFLARRDGNGLACTIKELGSGRTGSTLAEGRAAASASPELRFVTDGVALRGFVDGQCVVRAWDAKFAEGAAGLIATRGNANFSGFQAVSPPQRELVTVLTEDGTGRTRPGPEAERFEAYLGDLWRPLGARPQLTQLDGEPCFKLSGGALQYYSLRPGDVRVSMDVLRRDGKAVGLVICAQPQTRNTGYGLTVIGPRTVLTRDGQVVRSETLPAEAAGPLHLSLYRDGPAIVGQAGRALLAFCDPTPLDSGCAAVQVDGEATLDNLQLGATHALQYSFERVEPDWQPASGDWNFHSGMACIPWAYWLTGDGRQEPAMAWNRRTAPADLAVSFDVSEYTEGYENDEHRHFPYHDISLVIAAQEQALSSGYRFVIGAEGGRLLRLYRNGQLVKEQSDPRFAITMGGHCNTPRAIEVTAFKHGGSLRLVLQGIEALGYEDPAPLGPGFVGMGVANCRANYRDLFLYRDYTWSSPVGVASFSPS